MNHKKRYIAGGTSAVALSGTSLFFLVRFIMSLNTTAIGGEALAKENKLDLIKLDGIPAQVARVEENVADIKEDFIDFRTEQRKFNVKTESKLDRILDAVQR